MKNFGRNLLIFLTILIVIAFSGVIISFFALKYIGKLKRERLLKRLKSESEEEFVGKNFFHKDYDEPVKDGVISKKAAAKRKPVKTKAVVSKNLNDRQSELLEYLKRNKHASMSQIEGMFKNVTQRTLRRDFEKLEKEGIVRQVGSTRNSTYILV